MVSFRQQLPIYGCSLKFDQPTWHTYFLGEPIVALPNGSAISYHFHLKGRIMSSRQALFILVIAIALILGFGLFFDKLSKIEVKHPHQDDIEKVMERLRAR